MWRCSLTVLASMVMASGAQAEMRLIVCDSQAQLEQLFVLLAKGVDRDMALLMTNAQAANIAACEVKTVRFIPVENVGTVIYKEHVFTILKIEEISNSENTSTPVAIRYVLFRGKARLEP